MNPILLALAGIVVGSLFTVALCLVEEWTR